VIQCHCPGKTTNEKLWNKTGEESVLEQLGRRKWNWCGHMLSDDSIAEQALQWTLQGHRGRGRSRNTWKRNLKKKCGQQDSGLDGGR